MMMMMMMMLIRNYTCKMHEMKNEEIENENEMNVKIKKTPSISFPI